MRGYGTRCSFYTCLGLVCAGWVSVGLFLFCESLLSLGHDSWTCGLFGGQPGLCDVQRASRGSVSALQGGCTVSSGGSDICVLNISSVKYFLLLLRKGSF